MALSDCDGGGKPLKLRAGSLKEAVRSSSLMGGLCKRPDSRMPGKRKLRAMRRAEASKLSLIVSAHCIIFNIVGRGIFISPTLQLLYPDGIFILHGADTITFRNQ